jgi:uncharacterized membrane protein
LWYNLTLIFFDINITSLTPKLYQIIFKFYQFFVLVLVGYSFYFLYRKTPKRIWLFVLTLTGVTGLALILPDLAIGGARSTQLRFAIPCYLGIQLAIAHLIATKLIGISTSVWRQKLWQVVLITLVSGGVLSCVINSQSEVWWNKLRGDYVVESAQIINQSSSPLVIGSLPAFESLTLSHRLAPKVQLLVKPKCDNCRLNTQPEAQLDFPAIPKGFSDVFLLKSGLYERWLQEIENEPLYKLEPITSKFGETLLWKLRK